MIRRGVGTRSRFVLAFQLRASISSGAIRNYVYFDYPRCPHTIVDPAVARGMDITVHAVDSTSHPSSPFPISEDLGPPEGVDRGGARHSEYRGTSLNAPATQNSPVDAGVALAAPPNLRLRSFKPCMTSKMSNMALKLSDELPSSEPLTTFWAASANPLGEALQPRPTGLVHRLGRESDVTVNGTKSRPHLEWGSALALRQPGPNPSGINAIGLSANPAEMNYPKADNMLYRLPVVQTYHLAPLVEIARCRFGDDDPSLAFASPLWYLYPLCWPLLPDLYRSTANTSNWKRCSYRGVSVQKRSVSMLTSSRSQARRWLKFWRILINPAKEPESAGRTQEKGQAVQTRTPKEREIFIAVCPKPLKSSSLRRHIQDPASYPFRTGKGGITKALTMCRGPRSSNRPVV
ncbi:hypothetical protein GGX14DRAFT_407520 [Mycena pura]|uniref:Uncharacterized protein n=1 Tax=Mycena pura TaxID=153505 RepID=A0AAD6UMR9_9AGAR|nr:hypothetical protein GGX14DRAFT_407520 [Mycena pura]